MESRHISRVVAASPQTVYAFAADVSNLPRWAAGLAESPVEVRGDVLVVQSPMGEVTVRFVPANEYGVLDHDVTLADGETVHNPFRVMAHPDGAEVVMTVRRRELTDEAFEADCRQVETDLKALRTLVESSS